MKHFSTSKLLFALAFFLSLGLSARAEAPEGYLEISPYTENFKDATSTLSTFPTGWSRYQASGSISYTVKDSGRSGKCIGSYYSATDATIDLIVSPQVKGTISFWVQKYSTFYTPSVKIYKLNKEGDSFSYDPEPIYEVSADEWAGLTSSSVWGQITLPESLSDYTYLGFRIVYAYVTDFEATSALIPIVKKLEFTNTKSYVEGNTISSNSDGTADVTVKLQVKNSGNYPLTKSEEGENFTVSLARYAGHGTPINKFDPSYVTVDIPDLQPGEIKDMEIPCHFEVPSTDLPEVSFNDSSGEIGISIYALYDKDIAENIYTATTIGYLYIKPYKAIMNMTYEQNTSTTNVGTVSVNDKVVYLGIARDKVSRKFNIKNSGPAEMIVTGFDAPDFISVNIDGSQVNSFTVEPNGNKEVEIIISGEPGYKEGNIKFLFDGVVLRDNVNVAGEIVPQNAFFDDFEDYASGMDQWYAPSGSTTWTVGQYTTSPDERLRPQAATANVDNIYWPEYHLNEGRLSNSKNNTPGDDLISPLMSFEAGDKVSFYAAKKTNYGTDVKLIVSYSPDRSNWTTLETITPTVTGKEVNAFPGVGQYSGASGQNMLKRFEFDMPEGEYYIRLTAGYVLVDNFVGGELVDVPYDIVSEGIEIGKTRIVNNPVTVSAKFKNIDLKDVESNNQIATLYADGKPVATTEAQTIKPGESAVYLFTYTPHTEGEIAINAELQLGDYKVSSPTESIKIDKERAENVLQIGEIKTSTAFYPLNIGYKNSKSETIYTSEDLSELKGNVISKISYPYYKSSSNTVDNVKIWMSNSDNASLPTSYSTFTDVSGMELVFESQNHVFDKGGGQNASDYDNMSEMVFVLDTPFTYEEGSNLRVVVESRANNYSSTSFAMDNSIQKSFGYYDDNPSNYETGKGYVPSYNQKGFPVTFIYTEKVVPTVNGTVKNTAGAPVAGATVKVQSGDVIYETTTDDQGNWEMSIFQPELVYKVYVYVNGEEVYSGSLNMDAANDIVVEGSASSDVPEGYQKVQNYLEKFSSSSVASSRFNGPVDPLGWDKLIGDEVNGTQTYKMDYSTTSSGKDGYAVGTTTSSWTRKNYSTNVVTNLYDYIITPQVKGDVKFYLKRYSTSSSYVPKIQLYKMIKNEDGTFACDTASCIISSYSPDLTQILPNTSDWVEQTLNVGDDFCYLGFRLQSVYIDEFSADEAIIPIKKSISFGTITQKEGYKTTVSMNEEGSIPLGFTVDVTNTGNVAIGGEDGLLIKVGSKASNSDAEYADVIWTGPLPVIEPGQTAKVDIETTYEVPSSFKLRDDGTYYFPIYVFEDWSEAPASKQVSWYTVKPYNSIMNIRYDYYTDTNGSTQTSDVDASKKIFFGVSQNPVERNFHLKNEGGAPMNVTEVELPDGFQLSGIEIPTVIAPETTVDFQVVMTGTPGFKDGNIKFVTDGLAVRDNFNVSGEIVDPEKFFDDFETFENDSDVAPWYIPSGNTWKIGGYQYSSSSATNERSTSNEFYPEYYVNDGRLYNTAQTEKGEDIYSPLMSFENGDKISFYAAKRTNNGSDVRLIVSYSKDRANWTELGRITVTNDNPDLQFSSGTSTSPTSAGQNILKRFEFDMPAGEYYVALNAGYVLVDNFVGGKLVDVDYDIVPVSAEVSRTKMVNVPIDFTATFLNLHGEAVPAADQMVSLYANGVKVASADAQEIPASGNVAYEFTYIPHVAGETDLYAEIAIGEYSVSSSVITVNIAEESAESEFTVGEILDTSNYVPLATGYNNSMSEIVYFADQLAGLKGNTITKISFPYYKTEANASERLRIWMSNSDSDAVPSTYADRTDVETMTLVYEFEGYNFEVGGSSKTDMINMEFVLDEMFNYEPGKNLRIVVESLGTTWKTAYFGLDNSDPTHKTFYYRNDTRSTFENGTATGPSYVGNVNGFPVINIFTKQDITPTTGTVSNSAGNAVAGASVKAQAKDADVYYETESDEAGNWSITIFQPQYDYTLTVSAEGYDEPYEGDLLVGEVNNVVLKGGVEPLPGDANANGEVTVADAITVGNYIIDIVHPNFSFVNADVDGNEVINASDINGVINIVLGYDYNAKKEVSRHSVSNDRLVIDDFVVPSAQPFVIPVRLENSHAYSSIQAEIVIPDGMTVEAVTTAERSAAHTLLSNKVDGKVKVVLFSADNTPFADAEGALLNLVVKADEDCGNLFIEGIYASEPNTDGYDLNFEGGQNVTGTSGISGFDAENDGVRYFTVDGIEVFNPEKGQILIRVEGNKAVKVIY